MRKSHAYRLMDVAENMGDRFPTVGNLPAKALYHLSAPPSSDNVRDEVTTKIESGEVKPTHAAIKEAVEKAKADLRSQQERQTERLHTELMHKRGMRADYEP
jgi:hypothetical protein